MILNYYPFEYWSDISVDGVGGVDGFYGPPHGVVVFFGVVAGEEEVVAEFDAEVDGVVVGVGVPVRFQGGNSRVYARIPMGVRGSEEVFTVFDQDVPDDDGVLDGSVLLVEESSVEEVPLMGAELEGFCEVLDLLEDPLGAGVVLDAFSVAVPEFDIISWEDFDEAAGVVVLKLGYPIHVEVD